MRVLAAHFAELIPHGHSVLDVGCGDGLVAESIMMCRPDLKISGVDVMVRPSARIPVSAYDGRTLPLDDNSIDTLLFCDVLHHTENPVALLREGARVARHGVVIKDHTLSGWLARPRLLLMDYVGNAPHGVVLPFNFFTEREWQHAYVAAGLAVTHVRTDLRLYPVWAEPFFGRRLHFMTQCVVTPTNMVRVEKDSESTGQGRITQER